ncbi:Uncharacterised protein [Mycobacteroides abscessus subsp. abscessus]|nr:Uncharacterised protein [Mycobacteroides abscessus subsp. abscessus]
MGSPAASAAQRAVLELCSPTCPTAPLITSSISAGSIPVRSTSSRIACACRSTGCTPESEPPGLPLPTGVRTASMITASLMIYDSPLNSLISVYAR